MEWGWGGIFCEQNEFNDVINVTLICPWEGLSLSGLFGNWFPSSYEEPSPSAGR